MTKVCINSTLPTKMANKIPAWYGHNFLGLRNRRREGSGKEGKGRGDWEERKREMLPFPFPFHAFLYLPSPPLFLRLPRRLNLLGALSILLNFVRIPWMFWR